MYEENNLVLVPVKRSEEKREKEIQELDKEQGSKEQFVIPRRWLVQ
jgi:hypothetical protein